MEITYTLTTDDYREGYKAYRNRSFLRRCFYWVLYAAIVVFIVLPLVVFAIGREDDFGQLVPLLCIGVIWALLFWVYIPYRMKSALKQNPSAQGERTVNIDDSGLHARSSLVDTKVAWATIIDARETKSIYALFLSPNQFLPIPKRAMTEAQQQEFRALLQKHVGRGKADAASASTPPGTPASLS